MKTILSLLLCAGALFGAIDTTGHSASYMTTPAATAINNLGNGNGTGLSIHFYVRFTSTAGDLVDKNRGGAGWSLLYVGGVGIRFFHNTSGTRVQRDCSTSITTSVLHSVLVTWDGSLTGANIHIYLDGTECSYSTTQNGTGTLSDDSARPLDIAGNAASAQLAGSTEELAIWNVVISTASDIANLSKSFRAGICTMVQSGSLKGYWPFNDEPSGTNYGTAIDRSGNGGNMTATGTVNSDGGRLGLR